MLLAASFFWGTTFVAQILGMEGLGPYTYAACRFALGTLFMWALWYIAENVRQSGARGRSARAFVRGFPSGLRCSWA